MNPKRSATLLLCLLLSLPSVQSLAMDEQPITLERRIASNTARTLANLPEAARARTDSLVIGVPDLLGETNPFWVRTTGDQYLASLSFDELLFVNNAGEVGAGVASYSLSADQLTYTFTLAENVRYTDGTPLTSDDFINALYLLLMPGYDGVYDLARAGITGVNAYLLGETATIEGIARVSDSAFAVTLDHPNPNNLLFFAIPTLRVSLFGDMLRPEALDIADFDAFYAESLARARATDASGMAYGQYSLAESVPGTHAVLTKHDGYWRGTPYIGTVELLVVPIDPQAALETILGGMVDILSIIGDTQSVDLAFDTGFINLYTWDGDTLGYLGMDHANPLFEDAAVRQALAIGFNRSQARKNAIGRYGSLPTVLLFDSFDMQRDMLTEQFPYDPEKAAALLANAGWTAGEDGILEKNDKRFSFTLVYNTPNPVMDVLIEWMQVGYGELGIDMQTEQVSLEALIERIDNGDYDMYFQARRLPSSATLAADLFIGDSHLNANGYTSAALDRFLAWSALETDPTRQTVVQEGMYLELYAELPFIPLYRRSEMLLISGRVMNATVTTAHEITSDVYRFFLVDTLEGQW